jgi:CysZ protein
MAAQYSDDRSVCNCIASHHRAPAMVESAMLFKAFGLAFAQLRDPGFRRPLFFGLLGAIVIFAALWVIAWWTLAHTALFETGWLNWLVDIGGSLAGLFLTILLYPAVAGAVLSLFLDDAIDAVEQRHYPALPPPRRPGIGEQIWSAVRLLGVAVGLNLLVLPLYLLPVINLMIFYGLNGYILGREYFDMVAARRLEPEEQNRFRRHCYYGWFAIGVGIAALSTLPVINLVAPLVGAGAMTHGFTAWRGKASRQALE